MSPHFFPTLRLARTGGMTMNAPEAPWTFEAVQTLIALAKEGFPPSVISLKLKRSVADVRAKLVDLGLSPPAEA
jgi:hypothetical protein